MTEEEFLNEFGESKKDQIPLRIAPAPTRPASEIPPRPWLYGRHILRGMITVIIAPGGVGKTQVGMNIGMSLAIGRRLLGDWVHKRVNTLIFNLEDPLVEMERRIAAIRLLHGIKPHEIDGRLFLASGRDRALCMAREEVTIDGSRVVFPDMDALIAVGKEHDIGCIIVDPYIRSHQLDENSNTLQAQAVAAWAQVAETLQCGILVAHHTRKGANMDVDSARGAKALTDHARSALLLKSMDVNDAQKWSIKEEDRHRYVYLEDVKSNMAPPSAKHRWMEMVDVELGNGTPEYPKGDTLTALRPWKPPELDIPIEEINAFLDVVDAADPPLSKHKNAHPRWIVTHLTEALPLTEAQAVELVAQWLQNGVLVEQAFFDDKHRLFRGLRSKLRPGPA